MMQGFNPSVMPGGGLQLVVLEDGQIQTRSLHSMYVYLKGMGYLDQGANFGSPQGGHYYGTAAAAQSPHGTSFPGAGQPTQGTALDAQERRRMKVKINRAVLQCIDLKEKKRKLEEILKMQEDHIQYLEEQCKRNGVTYDSLPKSPLGTASNILNPRDAGKPPIPRTSRHRRSSGRRGSRRLSISSSQRGSRRSSISSSQRSSSQRSMGSNPSPRPETSSRMTTGRTGSDRDVTKSPVVVAATATTPVSSDDPPWKSQQKAPRRSIKQKAVESAAAPEWMTKFKEIGQRSEEDVVEAPGSKIFLEGGAPSGVANDEEERRQREEREREAEEEEIKQMMRDAEEARLKAEEDEKRLAEELEAIARADEENEKRKKAEEQAKEAGQEKKTAEEAPKEAKKSAFDSDSESEEEESESSSEKKVAPTPVPPAAKKKSVLDSSSEEDSSSSPAKKKAPAPVTPTPTTAPEPPPAKKKKSILDSSSDEDSSSSPAKKAPAPAPAPPPVPAAKKKSSFLDSSSEEDSSSAPVAKAPAPPAAAPAAAKAPKKKSSFFDDSSSDDDSS